MATTKEEKTERLAFRMSPSEAAMLRELADAEGEAAATIVRQLIRRAHAEKFPKRPKK
jgi:uncharacterized protein (DUF1778 family)